MPCSRQSFPGFNPETRRRCRLNDPSRSANSPTAAWSLWHGRRLIGLLAAGLFALGLGDEPFVDEYAYITQSYQPDLVFAGRIERPCLARWPGATTLFPCPSISSISRSARPGFLVPRHGTPLAWYDNTSYRWGSTRELLIARLPSIFMGAVGCVAIFCHWHDPVKDERTGCDRGVPAGDQPALPAARPPGHVRGRLRGVLARRRWPWVLGLEIACSAREPIALGLAALDRGRMLGGPVDPGQVQRHPGAASHWSPGPAWALACPACPRAQACAWPPGPAARSWPPGRSSSRSTRS